MKCRSAEHATTVRDGQLGRAAADVDVQHPALFFSGIRHRAGAMGGEQRFEIVARRGADEIAALGGEKVGNGARIVAPDRFAGEDDRAGVDVARADKPASWYAASTRRPSACSSTLFATRAIGCQMNRRQVERIAFGDDKAAGEFPAEPAQDELRENDLRGRRADVDADARERDRVELPQRMFLLDVEFVRVMVMIVGKIVHGTILHKGGGRSPYSA